MWLYILIAVFILAAYLFIVIKSAAEKKLPGNAKKLYTNVLDWIHRNTILLVLVLAASYMLIPIGFGFLIILIVGIGALVILLSGFGLWAYTKFKFIKDFNPELSSAVVIGVLRAFSTLAAGLTVGYYLSEYIRVSKPQ
ncbi:MAG: hypothetical protein M1419_01215 [Bacteroidetes bacterium]|nr:hypothetical protein [Bacteroidota bacterium]